MAFLVQALLEFLFGAGSTAGSAIGGVLIDVSDGGWFQVNSMVEHTLRETAREGRKVIKHY